MLGNDGTILQMKAVKKKFAPCSPSALVACALSSFVRLCDDGLLLLPGYYTKPKPIGFQYQFFNACRVRQTRIQVYHSHIFNSIGFGNKQERDDESKYFRETIMLLHPVNSHLTFMNLER